MIAAFIAARPVITDRVVMRKAPEQVYAYARAAARAYLDDYYRTKIPLRS